MQTAAGKSFAEVADGLHREQRRGGPGILVADTAVAQVAGAALSGADRLGVLYAFLRSFAHGVQRVIYGSARVYAGAGTLLPRI